MNEDNGSTYSIDGVMSCQTSISIGDSSSRGGSSVRFSDPVCADPRLQHKSNKNHVHDPDLEGGRPSWYDSHASYIEHDTTDEETTLSSLSSMDVLSVRRMREHQREARKCGGNDERGDNETRSTWSSSESRLSNSTLSGGSMYYSVSLSSITSVGRSSRASNRSDASSRSRDGGPSRRPLLWPTTLLVGLGLIAVVKMGFVELKLEIDQFGSLHGLGGGGKRYDQRRSLMMLDVEEEQRYGDRGHFYDFESLSHLERQRASAQQQLERSQARAKFFDYGVAGAAEEDPLRDDDEDFRKMWARKLARQREKQQELRRLEQEKQEEARQQPEQAGKVDVLNSESSRP